jgi:site-specific recombinase XerD
VEQPAPPKLLDRVRQSIRLKHYSYRTEQTYVSWIKRYILFHNKQHPQDMGVEEVPAFLSHLAVVDQVAASTQNQALSALLILYKVVLEQELESVDALRAKNLGIYRLYSLSTKFKPSLIRCLENTSY